MSVSTSINPIISSASQTEPTQFNRTRCEVWTRVMGYHRPVSQFNLGKKSEHFERCHFQEKPSLKHCFSVTAN